MIRQWYRMHDVNNKGAFPIPRHEATRWNGEGYGIFWTVNEFSGARQISNLLAIWSWAIDIDEGPKIDQRAAIEGCPLVPSMVVETKRGYQVYWNAKDAQGCHWNSIVLDRLVPYFGADANARDLARILRVPGFNHLKDPADPFMVRKVHEFNVAYTEAEMVEAFPESAAAKKAQEVHSEARKDYDSTHDKFWDAVFALDCEDGLRRLSGHPACGGERFEFRETRNGKNILVDGKGSSAWIDKHKRIGSLSKGGPTLIQWLQWYGASVKEAVRILKTIFPHLDKLR